MFVKLFLKAAIRMQLYKYNKKTIQIILDKSIVYKYNLIIKVFGVINMNNHESINEILVRLFANILDIEEKCLGVGEFSDLSITEMHIIDNIGIGKERNMSNTAKDLRITSGTLTTAIDNLIKKGYVERRRSSDDRRVVKIKLTNKGIGAYKAHEDFHKDLVVSALMQLDDRGEEILAKVLTNIDIFFKEKYHYK